MSESFLGFFFILAFGLGTWLVHGFVYPEFSGFNRVVRAHPDRPDSRPSRTFPLSYADFGRPWSYWIGMAFQVCEDGVRMRPHFYSSPVAKAAFLPWEAFATFPTQHLLLKKCGIRWGPTAGETFYIKADLARQLAQASGGAFGANDFSARKD